MVSVTTSQLSMILMQRRLNALLDPKQYTAENASGFYTSEEAGCTPWRQPWRATFWSKSGPVDPEDKKRIRRRLEDLSRHIKVQINNCDVENTQSRILKKSIVEWSTMANTGYFVRPGPAQEGQAELQSLITINYKLLHHMLSGGLNVSPPSIRNHGILKLFRRARSREHRHYSRKH